MLPLLSLLLASDAPRELDALRLAPQVLTLENGLTLVVHEDHRAPRVALSMRVRAGAAEDPPGATGAAHVLEHLMFDGASSSEDIDYDRLLAEAGGSTNAWTSHDETVYVVEGPAGLLERALWLEADRLRGIQAGLDPAAVENQRLVVLNERLRDELSDDIYPRYALEWLLWPEGNPYRMPVLGTREDLGKVDAATLEGMHRAWYVPGNLVLVVVGDVEAAEVVEIARRTLGALPAAPVPARVSAEALVPELPWLKGEERWLLREDIADQHLYVAWQTVPRGHPDEAALDVLAELLSGGRGTLLDDALYYRRQRATELGVWTSNGRLGGELIFHAARDDQRLLPMLRALDGALDSLRARPPSPEAVARAVSRRWAASLRSLERLSDVAEVLGDCQVTHGDADCLADELERYLSVSPEDVQRVANVYLGEARVVLSVVSEGEERYALPGSLEVYAP
ncbi:MAG: insulinase family protein [Alphaproteobacteria bacterium]|nr:insulinase family protein [Alphaproteobacteria bacterium]MCB9794964.1 insulinase family protein [Alphaproteobacteria bacterium]